MQVTNYIKTGLLALVTLVGASSCLGKKAPVEEPPGPPVFYSETKYPFGGFFEVTEVKASYLTEPTAEINPKKDAHYWHLHVPGSKPIISRKHTPERHLQVYQERKMRSDVSVIDPSPETRYFASYGVEAIRLTFVPKDQGQEIDLSSQATLLYEQWYKMLYKGGSVPIGGSTSSQLYPIIREEATLSSLTKEGLYWVFWSRNEWFKYQPSSSYLYIRKDAVDLSQGKLYLSIKREGKGDLSVELPSK